VIAILDYGMGNLRSVEKALEHVGARTVRTADHDVVRDADAVVLPGVGAFRRAMEAVHDRGLDELVRERVDAGVPVIGLCLGMQLLFEHSSELGGALGIGVLEGVVRPLDSGGLKVPQIGWNPVAWRGHSPLADGLPDPTPMYHVHSFAVRPEHAEDVLGTAHYGSEFVTAVGRGNVFGVQFHPEKSGAHGLRLLQNFARVGVAA
jgi:imidazole glycerol-phosphate synthase subunit HisH